MLVRSDPCWLQQPGQKNRKPAQAALDPDQDGQIECLLASDRVFSLFELDYGGYLAYLFIRSEDGQVHQVVAASSNLISGTSPAESWDLSRQVLADPRSLPGAFYIPLLPAGQAGRAQAVGVLATPATVQGALYASVVERFANGVELLQDTCPGLVQQIERGNLAGEETRTILEHALQPMIERQIDTVVLGCTHYPFVIPLIQQIVGKNVRVIDPAPAVARQIERVLEARELKNRSSAKGSLCFYTSGDVRELTSLLPVLLGDTGEVNKVEWLNDRDIKSDGHP